MAVKKLTAISNWSGLSSDTKPTDGPPGSTFYETDTTSDWFYNGVVWNKRLKMTTDFFTEVAKGNIPGHSAMLKFGENPSIDNAVTFETIWDGGGTYIPPTIARIHNVVSTSVEDDGTPVLSSGTATGGSATTIEDSGADFVTDTVSVFDEVLNDDNVSIGTVANVTATILTVRQWTNPSSGAATVPTESGDSYRVVSNVGTGASFIHILGLNASFEEIEEFVVLNGQGVVVTANAYIRQYRARAFGPNTAAVDGIITSTAQTDGTVTCQIIGDNNQTLMAIYTVPITKTGYMLAFWGTISGKTGANVDIDMRAGNLDRLGYIIQNRAAMGVGSSSFRYDYKIPVEVPGGSDVWMEASSDTNSTSVSGGFDMLLEDN